MRIAVIGATGQLGTDIAKVLSSDHDVIPLSHDVLEVTDQEAVEAALKDDSLDAVVNCAAFHRVDDCEDDPDKAFRVNATGAVNVAGACSESKATCVYVSTDYVFDGSKHEPYVETDSARPVNVYGISKLAGEIATMSYSDDWVVARVSSLFGAAGSSGKGGNFIEAILAKAKSGEGLTVVDDILMSPTYTVHAARKLKSLLETGERGLFHLSNRGSCSWHEFATAIVEFAGLDVEIARIRSDQYPSRAKRPRNSSLATDNEAGGEPPIDWREGLISYLEEKGHLSAAERSR